MVHFSRMLHPGVRRHTGILNAMINVAFKNFDIDRSGPAYLNSFSPSDIQAAGGLN